MTVGADLAWIILTVSLLNSILQLWLGFTVLLSAERRRGGIWLTGGALLVGGGFFLAHAAILGLGVDELAQAINVWWPLAWGPGIALPLAWYVVILWYAGFWENRPRPLYRRQRPWFVATIVLALGVVGLFLATSPTLFAPPGSAPPGPPAPKIGDVPLLALCYPLFIVLCFVLSLDALRHPEPSRRVMGDLARRRARPWLAAVAVVLLLVSLLVGGMMPWLVLFVRQQRLDHIAPTVALAVAWGDLAVASLVAVATLLLGQALVSYEIFTGKTLPRRGLRRQWRNVVVLAAGYSLVVGLGAALGFRPIYGLLFATLLVAFFYALLGRHSYVERERYIDHLRPFLASLRLYDSLRAGTTDPAPPVDIATAFRALCGDVLGARLAYLVAVGPLSPLGGPALAYPAGAASPPAVIEVVAECQTPAIACLPLDPPSYGGATWAVPLRNERRLIGLLLLGDKRDGGLYTQEEIEIARTGGERLLDTQATAQMAGLLVALQRRQLAEGQVLDQGTRRAIHDDILPRLHATMLALSAASEGEAADALTQLADVHRRLSNLLRELPPATAPAVARLGLSGALRQTVDLELGRAFDDVTWQAEPAAERWARTLPPLAAEVVFCAAREAIRNAARHGRGDGARLLHLRVATLWRDGLELQIEDDGVGWGQEETPAAGGNGQGLALHSTLMAVIGGALTTESLPGQYTRVVLSLPEGSW